MSSTQQSPSLSAKLKTKNAADRLKHGSPKLQEVLRQRCRQRMREKRGQLFDRRRQGLMETDEEVHKALTEIVRSELSQLATVDLDDDDTIISSDASRPLTEEEALFLENEIIAEEEEWIFMELDRMWQDEFSLATFAEESLKDNVVCPLCEKDVIAETPDALSCLTCDFRMPRKVSLEEFGQIIQDKLSAHSSNCCGQPGFMLLPETSTVNLYLTCETCSAFAHII